MTGIKIHSCESQSKLFFSKIVELIKGGEVPSELSLRDNF